MARKVRFTDADAIAKAAAEKNAQLSVTGLLLYTPSYFIQVLEGDKRSVESTFARISKDERHEEVVILAKAEIEERQFGRWGMRAVMPTREVSSAAIGQLTGSSALELLLSARAEA